MRMMLKVTLPVDTANTAVRNGTLGKTMQKILADLKPEAAYFVEDNGSRAGYIFFDMNDSSELPAIAEPWFLAFNAQITVRPAMTVEDLGRGMPAMERAVKTYAAAAGA